MIDEQTKQLIIDTARIEEVVSDFVQLRRKGSGFVGLCPFHKDRHPSFIVTPSKNICKCFACGGGGTPISFIMKMQNLSFVEALRYLAQKYNIDVPERELSEEEQLKQNEREALYLANETASKFFVEQLLATDEGLDIALPYLTNRGIRPETIKTFGLGYSPSDRKALVKYVERQGYQLDSFVQTGLCYAPQDGRGSADRYSDRVIFPIYNVSGRVVGFGGRTMSKSDKIAKYINSPENPIYDKSSELYGLFQAKRAISRQDRCIIVEGYLDVISMHQVGIENVVATSGTALTERQIHLIRRFSQNVTVIFDGDGPGIKAALRSIDMLLAEGMQIKLLLLPNGEDPDDFVKRRTLSEINAYMEAEQKDFLQFKSDLYASQMEGDPQRKTELMRDILQSIASIPDSLERIVYVQQMAQLYGVSEELLLQQIRQERFTRGRVSQYTPPTSSVSTPPQGQQENLKQEPSPLDRPLRPSELDLLRMVVRYGERLLRFPSIEAPLEGDPVEDVPMIQIPVALYLHNELEQDDIPIRSPLCKLIVSEAAHLMEQQSNAEEAALARTCGAYLSNHETPQVAAMAVDLLASPYKISRQARISLQMPDGDEEQYTDEQIQEMANKTVLAFKFDYCTQRISEITQQIKELESNADTEMREYEQNILLLKLQEVIAIRKQLAQFLDGRVITP